MIVSDLIIYPLNLISGREQHDLPGLMVAGAPRRAARMRAQDQLILSVSLRAASGPQAGAESSAYTTSQQKEMLANLADTYYAFSGSVTAGLRAVASSLNEFLLARNLKAAGGIQTVAILNMLVVQRSNLYIAHAGPTHTFVLSNTQVQHFDDKSGSAGRGLGLSRQAIPRFYQAEFESGDLLILCPDPPNTWTARALAASPRLNFEQLRRRLLSDPPLELRAAVIRLQAGKGKVSYWKPGEPSERRAETAQTPVPTADLPPVEPAPEIAESLAASIPAPEQPAVDIPPTEPDLQPQAFQTAPPADQAPPLPEESAPPKTGLGVFLGRLVRRSGAQPAGADRPEPRPRRGRRPEVQLAVDRPAAALPQAFPAAEADFSAPYTTSPAVDAQAEMHPVTANHYEPAVMPAVQPHTEQVPAAEPVPREPSAFDQAVTGAARSIRGVWQKGASSRAQVSGSMATTARKVLPRRVDEAGKLVPLFNFSAGTMLGIAVLIPIIVVAVATAVYFQAGRGEQFQVLFEQAQQYAQQSAQLTDPLQQREGWTRTLAVLDEAETYKRTGESEALRVQIHNSLDTLNGYVRLDYRPVVRDFAGDVNITRIIASLNDVYMLDSSQGRIIRLYRTATGYEIDATFSCGPGEAGSLVVQPLIDLAPMPINNEPRATVVGLDESGNLVYCAPNMDGFESRPLAPPDLGWGKIQAMKMYGARLYVLDPLNNAVYYYDSDKGIYPDKPHFYFGDLIPKMDDVIDIAIDQEFLYLLHADGQMTICEGGGYSFAPTTCSDAPYGDPRPGMEPSPLRFDGANFTQLQATQPPDPSLFALDAANQSIYHLSLRRLNLQREYRPPVNADFPVPDTPPTAFAVTPNRRALVAFGSQVFFAPIP